MATLLDQQIKPCFLLTFSFQTRNFIFRFPGTSEALEDLLKISVYIYAGKHLCIYVYLSCTLVVSELNIHVYAYNYDKCLLYLLVLTLMSPF